MSVNFYDGSGLMIGCDAHNGIDQKLYPYLVTVPTFQYWPHITYKETPRVTSDGWVMIKDGCDWYVVPHVPLPPNNPLAWPTVPGIVVDSGSKAFMSVHSVTGQGDPLATALLGCVGLNADCWEWGLSLPTGIVLQFNSVKTSPTLGDYLGAVAGLAVDNIIGAVVDLVVGKSVDSDVAQSVIKHLIRRFPDIAKELGIEGDIVNWIVDTPGETKKAVQKLVDG